jgi:hypothetical protein
MATVGNYQILSGQFFLDKSFFLDIIIIIIIIIIDLEEYETLEQ